MATFSAQSILPVYSTELIPTCIVQTRVELTEDYYIFSESDSTQAYEGLKGIHTTDGGWYFTPIIHPLAKDLVQKVYEAATNATPHAYIKALIDKYFKFCDYDATSIDDSFGAIDIPAFNGQSVSYVLRHFDILKANWWYVEKSSLIIHWDDGTIASGKHFRSGTEFMKNVEQIPFDKADLVTIEGGYLDGEILTSTAHVATPGSVEIIEKTPAIVTQAMLDTMSAAALAMWEQAQKFYTAITAGNGLYQYGRTATFSTHKPLSVSSATYFIHSASYDLISRVGSLTMGVYMTVPPRTRDKPQENKQLIDNLEKAVHDSSTKRWAECICGGALDNINFQYYGLEFRNVDGTDFSMGFQCSLPLHLNDGQALHIDQIRMNLTDGDAGDYIDRILVYGHLAIAASATLLDDTDNYSTVNTNRDLTFSTPFDADTHEAIGIRMFLFVTNAFDFGLKYVKVRFWYE